ncbi:MAG: AMP-binding protein, partial [Candidatus Methanomethylicia archaeon]
GLPIPGFHLDVINDYGKSVREFIGELIIRNPWPSTPIESPREFQENWINGYYRTGDYALMNKDGYIFALGRRDTVMKVSGYRLSPGAMEETLQRTLDLNKVIVVGEPDEIRFEAPTIIIEDHVKGDEVRRIVREYIGPIADPKNIVSKKLPDMPKVGLRRMIKDEFWKMDYGDEITSK